MFENNVILVQEKHPGLWQGPDHGYLVWREPDSFKTLPKQVKPPPKKTVGKMLHRLMSCGLVSSILIDEDGHVLGGHKGLKRLQALGPVFIPALMLTGLTERRAVFGIAQFNNAVCSRLKTPPRLIDKPHPKHELANRSFAELA